MTRIPRTRGDGPLWSRSVRRRCSDSPHTRGWTPRPMDEQQAVVGFPAHAGMDLELHPLVRGRLRIPRTRGDGPDVGVAASGQLEDSPHTRGWTLQCIEGHRRPGGFPAHAGMDPSARSACRSGRRIPRTRGDGPMANSNSGPVPVDSPHTRGWTARRQVLQRHHPGFPAHAGMDPSARRSRRRSCRIPRTRGDGPQSGCPTGTASTDSPHTRGWTALGPAARCRRDGFPAHAGMDPGLVGAVVPRGRIPRTRGDGPRRGSGRSWPSRDSPHTRGWTRREHVFAEPLRGFPAHAGMDPPTRWTRRSTRGIPRTRGDGPHRGHGCGARGEDSPHTRGWTHANKERLVEEAGFPAHAGMDRAGTRGRCARARIPRTRGDGPLSGVCVLPDGSDSPHTRGWTSITADSASPTWGFPAHAGMDPLAVTRADRPRRIPRTRGDGPVAGQRADC